MKHVIEGQVYFDSYPEYQQHVYNIMGDAQKYCEIASWLPLQYSIQHMKYLQVTSQKKG